MRRGARAAWTIMSRAAGIDGPCACKTSPIRLCAQNQCTRCSAHLSCPCLFVWTLGALLFGTSTDNWRENVCFKVKGPLVSCESAAEARQSGDRHAMYCFGRKRCLNSPLCPWNRREGLASAIDTRIDNYGYLQSREQEGTVWTSVNPSHRSIGLCHGACCVRSRRARQSSADENLGSGSSVGRRAAP